MLAKKCPKCGAVWYTELPKCAFCGVEGVEQPSSTHTGRLPEKPAAAPAPVEAAVAVVEAPPLPLAAAEATRAAEPSPEPKPVAAEIVEPARLPPEPGLMSLSAAERRPDPRTLPPAPKVPSAKAPGICAGLALAACAVMPLPSFLQVERIPGILLLIALAILIPFAPLAWTLGRRYEDRCIDLGFRPAPAGRTGRLMGMIVTFLMAVEASALLVLTALRRM
ncbi:MAG TPA: hypothetical protein VE981_14430 [Planctomycetota bacterium]|nr:hypothetical protein [Planctomycetota bacterium]